VNYSETILSGLGTDNFGEQELSLIHSRNYYGGDCDQLVIRVSPSTKETSGNLLPSIKSSHLKIA